jgi:hypothetical protein
MSISRPFAYNTGSTISGTIQVGTLSVGTPTSGFTTNPQYWMGADEELGYVIAGSVPDNSQPTPVSGLTASVQFWRSVELTEGSFVELTNKVFNQSFTGGTQASNWLTSNGYWNSWVVPTPTPTSTQTPTPTPTSTQTPTPTPTITPTQTQTPTMTPTQTITPTQTPTPTLTPSSTPTIQATYITNATQLTNNTTFTFNNVSIGGPGLIVVTVNSKGGFGINTATIGGVSATVENATSDDNSVASIIYARITANVTTANIQLVFFATSNAVNIGTYRITNNVSDIAVTNWYTDWTTPTTNRRAMSIPFSSANTKTIITTVTETGITGPSGQNITFSSSPSTTTNYYQQASNVPTPYYAAAGGLTRVSPGSTSLTITANFADDSNLGVMNAIGFN